MTIFYIVKCPTSNVNFGVIFSNRFVDLKFNIEENILKKEK